MKKNIILAFIVFLLLGCAHPVKHKLYGKRYSTAAPRTVAVLPVGGNVESFRVKEIFRESVSQRLLDLGYEVMDSGAVDDVFFKGLKKVPDGMTPKELAALLPTDAVVYIYISKWNKDKVFGYAALKFSARFKLISRTGELLWKGKHKTKESSMGFDKKVLELGVLEAYEARIERLVDNVISTMPGVVREVGAGSEEEEKKEFFKWLPSS
jgi:hypothetical protein